MAKVSSVLVLAFCSFVASWSAAAQQSMQRLRVEGNQFVNETGDRVVLRGVSFSDPDRLERVGHWNREYFETAREWGANLVRFPVHPSAWRSRGREAYLELLDSGIALAGELGMYVIIDWHSIGNLRTDLYFRPMYETSMKETLEFWQAIAERYADNPVVAFYEIFNEPTQYNGRLGKLTWEQHVSIMEDVIHVIYAFNRRAIPLVGGLDWGYNISYVRDRPVAYPNVAYVTHPYPQKRAEPWPPEWQRDFGLIAEDYPIVATEFGFMSADGPGAHVPVISDEHYGEAIIDFFEERGISWTVWVFDPQWSPQMFTGWDFAPTAQGRFFRRKMLELNE
ncbi:MAG: glycoside hydrolase family 5 protein [Bacteroidetes bacterium]|nr:glycoside hydrolase family 5 protein [Bacteroidota bacterium]